MCLLCLSLKSQIPKLFRNDSVFPYLQPIYKLENLKVLRRSPDLLNDVKISRGQLQLIMKQILFIHILGVEAILVK